MTPEPDPPEPVTEASVTVKVVNSSGSNRTFHVEYNYNNNPDPYTAERYVSSGDTWELTPYTVPVGGKIKVYRTGYTAGDYTVTDVSGTVTVTFTTTGDGVWTVSDNLSRQVSTFVEVEIDDRKNIEY